MKGEGRKYTGQTDDGWVRRVEAAKQEVVVAAVALGRGKSVRKVL